MDETHVWVLLLSSGILVTFFLLIAVFWFSWWFTQNSQGISPYTGVPLRKTSELSYYNAEKVTRFMLNFHQYDNRPFNLRRSAFCRGTGRIFPKCVTIFETVKVNWNFLQQRFPGSYLSWGSLNEAQQDAIRELHGSLDGFQTEHSCPEPSPRLIDPAYVMFKPGPLYVDLNTKTLVGWKEVPDTELEVLIVQKPIK